MKHVVLPPFAMLLSGLLAATAVSAQERPASSVGNKCASDAECAGSSCIKYRCVAPPAPPPVAPPAPPPVTPPAPPPVTPAAVKCMTHAECSGDLLCVNHRCSNPDGAPFPSTTSSPTTPLVSSVRAADGQAVTFTLAPPPKFSLNFELAGRASYGSVAGVPYPGVGLEAGLSGIVGLAGFPDTHGGSWHGVAAQTFLRVGGGGWWIGDDGSRGSKTVGGAWMSLFYGVGAGYTWMHMSDIDLDYRQRGVGVMATYRLGGGNVWLFGDATGSASSIDHGPWLALILPEYDAHRGHLSYRFINLDIVFTEAQGGSLTFFEIGGGGAF